jgi:DNA-binding Lrp family transcriptional regulator
VTQPEIEAHGPDETVMTEEKNPAFESKLSPSAIAILRFVRTFEEGGQLQVFQMDAEFELLRRMVTSYRGSLYSLLTRRLVEVVNLGGVSIISQRDIMSLIVNLWEENISRLSRTELPFLEAAIKNPGAPLNSLATKAELSYAQTRRAQKRLSESGVLKTVGMLNTHKLGLERVLIIFESPSLVLSGPYVQKTLMVDGYSPLVLVVATIPHQKRSELLDTIRSFRGSTGGASVWLLSDGRPFFSGRYFNTQDGWNLDLLHFRLMLRKGGDPLLLADVATPSPLKSNRFTYADVKIIDALVDDYDSTGNDIVASTGLSSSTAFRKRSQLIKNRVVLPRARVNIPRLSDRVVCLLSPECSGDIITAWNHLPITYQSRIQNIEDLSEKKVLLVSALPAGSGRYLIDVLNDETSKIHDYSAHVVAAGTGQSTKVASMYDRRSDTWKWDVSKYFDALTYSVVRREASPIDIPLDLA